MSIVQNSSFLDQLIKMYDVAGLPVAIADNDFMIVWVSTSARSIQPCLTMPDGVRQLLRGYDLDKVKLEVAQRGSFITDHVDNLFADPSITICAVSQEQPGYYLIHPSYSLQQGSGMRPEGLPRTLSTFDAQYRTPIAAIFSAISLLHQGYSAFPEEEDRVKSKEHLQVINQNAFLLLRNCEWISTYTRLASGLSSANPKRVDIYYFLRELFCAAASTIESANIPLTSAIPNGILPIACDTDKLSTVIFNILSNSVRYTREGNYIDVRVRKHAVNISISITDHGLGIPPHVIPRVFEPYFSYDHNGYPFSGNGLGLSIAKDTVSVLGGTITLTSVLNEGTTVLFTLPIADGQTLPEAFFCDASDYVIDRFSKMHIALADCIPCPL